MFGFCLSRRQSHKEYWEEQSGFCCRVGQHKFCLGASRGRNQVQKGQRLHSLMDIKFVGGVLRIPQLNIYYETESQFTNLVAYEQYLPDGEPRYVSDYTFFLHCLINTPHDVELLRRRGIIGNCLGNDEEVSLMFNRLGKSILTSSKFSYSQTFADVNKHYRRRTKKWVAKLWRDYFNSPWSILKFLAAVALLALAFLQTFYTVYSYYNPKTNSNGPPSGS
ncbi:UNVERIFIED_CONTAM: hypothetical protein Sangu_1664300 [Sesamum angustifolium]|uniref:Uncharacterized protein n=1 Tax=Sesamum angustifolium TaxID=2727405 RepID=A0AAW2MJX6_9LAMI